MSTCGKPSSSNRSPQEPEWGRTAHKTSDLTTKTRGETDESQLMGILHRRLKYIFSFVQPFDDLAGFTAREIQDKESKDD